MADNATKMTRVNVTADEWRELRKAALDRNITTEKLIGNLIRVFLSRVAA